LRFFISAKVQKIIKNGKLKLQKYSKNDTDFFVGSGFSGIGGDCGFFLQ